MKPIAQQECEVPVILPSLLPALSGPHNQGALQSISTIQLGVVMPKVGPSRLVDREAVCEGLTHSNWALCPIVCAIIPGKKPILV